MNFEKFQSDVLISAGRLIFGIGRRLLLIRVITNLVGADGYGIWVAVLALSRLFTSMGNLHLDGALIRFSSEEDNRQQVFTDTLIGVAVSGLVAALGFVLLTQGFGLFSFSGVQLEGRLILAAAIFVYSEIVYQVLVNYPRTEGRVKTFEFIRTGRMTLEAVAIVSLLYVFRDISIALFGLVSVIVLVDLALLKAFLPDDLRLPRIGSYRTYLDYSLPMVPKEFAKSILTEADKYLIIYFLSPSAAGVYAVGYSISMLLSKLTIALDSTMYPSVMQAWDAKEFDELRTLYRTIYKWYSLIGIPALVGLSVLAYPVLRLISTPEIATKGSILIPVLGFGFFLRGYENPLTYVLAADKTTMSIAKINVVAAILNVALNLALLPTVGLIGAAVATTVSQFTIVVYVYWKVRHKLRFQIPFLDIGKVALSTVVMAVALVFFPISLGWQLQLLVYPGLGFTVYAVTVLVTGALDVGQVRQLLLRPN